MVRDLAVRWCGPLFSVLEYLAELRHAAPMAHWQKDSHAAGLPAGTVKNDHI
jgi:hypothetical protein